MKIGIAGLGLIGGSLAKAVKKHTQHEVYGYDGSESVLQAALSETLDGELNDGSLPLCELVIVCLYPADTVAYVTSHRGSFQKGVVVMDCCGVKSIICAPLREVAADSGFTFIGAHPMAGTERIGYRHSFAGLFHGSSLIVTPYEDTPADAITFVEDFALSIGFERIQKSTPEKHDRIIAYTSQLAHVVSCAYVVSPFSPDFDGFSAGSFQDMTRVARLNEHMWAELFIDNKEFLSLEIENLAGRLHQFAELIKNEKLDSLQALLRQAREVKQRIDPQDWEE